MNVSRNLRNQDCSSLFCTGNSSLLACFFFVSKTFIMNGHINQVFEDDGFRKPEVTFNMTAMPEQPVSIY